VGSRPTCPALLLTSPPISLPTSTTPPKGGHDTLPPHPPKAPLEEARAGPEGGERERGHRRRKKLQDKMSRISHKCAVVCLPLCVGQVKQLEATYPNSNQHASGFRLRFHWQHRAKQEFYTLFDGLSLSGDEAWSRGLNLWPLTLCLKSLPGLFGDEDLVQDWISTQQNKGLPKENCCAWPTWIPLGCDSETTFLFVNSSPSSPYYGHLRYIITNTQEDRFLACSLSKFFALLECYISQTERMVDPPDLIQWLQSNNSSSSS